LKKIIKQTLHLLNKKEKNTLARIVTLNIILSVADIAFLALLLAIIHFYTTDNAEASRLSVVLSKQQPVPAIGAFLLAFTLKNLIGYYITRSQYHFVYQVASRLSGEGIFQYLNGNYKDYVNISSAVRFRQICHQPIEFCNYVLSGLMQAGTEIFITLAAIVAILLFNATIFLLLLLLLLPPVIAATFSIRKKLRSSRRQVKETSEKATQYLNEALESYVESNIYDGQSFFAGRYASFQKKLNDNLASLQIAQAIPSRFMEIFAIFGLFILIVVNMLHKNAGTVDLINIGAFMAAAYKIIPGITRTANLVTQVRTYAFTMSDLMPPKESVAGHYNDIRDKVQTIRFENVSFTHGEKQILSHLNTTLDKGDFVGIAAASGRGKTTLINLLLGFLEVDDGTILFNGLPVSAPVRRQYWHDIAYVKQQTFLIHDSIARNITFATGTDDPGRLREVIKITGLDLLATENSEGWDKIVTDNGKNISGGQRQRIALARALYKNAGVIILDEPFNELDSLSETALLKHFRSMAAEQGKIVIIITHNAASLEYCHKVIRIDA